MNQQSSKLRIENVTKDSPWIQDIQALYEEAFPPRERFSFNYLIRVGARPGGHFEAIFDGDVLAGFCLWIEYSGVIYLCYLAVNSAARGKGYGSRILALFKERNPDSRLFLEIETMSDLNAPNRQQREKRLAFYQRNGFETTDISSKVLGDRYDVLIRCGEQITPREMNRVVRKVAGFPMSLSSYKQIK